MKILISLPSGTGLGAFAGMILGNLAGLVPRVALRDCALCYHASIFFGPRRGTVFSRHQAVAGRTCAALFVLWATAGFDTDAFAVYPNPAGTIDSGPVDLVFVTIMPTLVAVSTAGYSGRRVAESWTRKAQEAGTENGPPTVAESLLKG